MTAQIAIFTVRLSRDQLRPLAQEIQKTTGGALRSIGPRLVYRVVMMKGIPTLLKQ